MGPCNSKDPGKRLIPPQTKESHPSNKNNVPNSKETNEPQKELNFEVTISNIKATNITQVKSLLGFFFKNSSSKKTMRIPFFLPIKNGKKANQALC